MKPNAYKPASLTHTFNLRHLLMHSYYEVSHSRLQRSENESLHDIYIYIYIYIYTYQELVNAVSYMYHTLSKNSSLGSRSPAFLGGPTLRKESGHARCRGVLHNSTLMNETRPGVCCEALVQGLRGNTCISSYLIVFLDTDSK